MVYAIIGACHYTLKFIACSETRNLTFKASSCEIPVKGVPFTSKIESPGLKPALSATLPSSTLEIYTPTPATIQFHLYEERGKKLQGYMVDRLLLHVFFNKALQFNPCTCGKLLY